MLLYTVILLFGLETGAIAYLNAKSVSSDGYLYPAFCTKIVTHKHLLKTFRSYIEYRAIVETIDQEKGAEFLATITKEYSNLCPFLKKIFQEDKYGMPVRFQYPPYGTCSPTILRYIKIAGDLQREFGDISKFNIVEIGGGFGGQCKIIHNTYGFKHYTLIDLPQCAQLINLYLSHFNIPNITTISCTQLQEPLPCDLVISNYAFSEIDREGQLEYINNIISDAPHGYMIYNSMPSVNPFTVDEFIAILKSKNKIVKVIREIPETSSENVTIIWHA